MDVDGVGHGRRRGAPRRPPGPGDVSRLTVDGTRLAIVGRPPTSVRGRATPRLRPCIAAPTPSSSGRRSSWARWRSSRRSALDKRLADPEGFLGPSWLRLPMLLFGAFLLDMLPRTLWQSRMNPAEVARDRPGAGAHPLDARADDPRRDGPRLLLHHLRQLPEPEVVPAVRAWATRSTTASCTSSTRRCSSATSPATCCTPCSAPASRARPVAHLPVVPAAGAAGADRVAGLVAQHLLRLLVRHLPVHRLDARHHRPTTRCRRWARASSTPGSTTTWPRPRRPS